MSKKRYAPKFSDVAYIREAFFDARQEVLSNLDVRDRETEKSINQDVVEELVYFLKDMRDIIPSHTKLVDERFALGLVDLAICCGPSKVAPAARETLVAAVNHNESLLEVIDPIIIEKLESGIKDGNDFAIHSACCLYESLAVGREGIYLNNSYFTRHALIEARKRLTKLTRKRIDVIPVRAIA